MATIDDSNDIPTQLLSADVAVSDESDPKPWGRLFYIFRGATVCYDLFGDECHIGRGDDSSIRIDSLTCSKRHCAIYRICKSSETCAVIVDSSTNGTIVNDRALPKNVETLLKHGDVVEIRQGHKFIYHETTTETYEPDDPEFDSVSCDYLFIKQLGIGTYAVATKVICRKTSACYACKVVCKRKAGLGDRQALSPITLEKIPEIEAMKRLKHPNIVQIRDVRQTLRKLYIFMQLVEGGDLFSYLAALVTVPEDEVRFITFQLLHAIKYLHDNSITHRDIKPENILLVQPSKFSQILLTDFGLAKIIHSDTKMKTLCGTLNYLAPEIIEIRASSKKGSYTCAVDCWALGILIYYLIAGYFPFEHTDDDELRAMIMKSDVSFNCKWFNWDAISEDCKDIIKSFLNRDPNERLDISQAFSHPWIKSNISELASMWKEFAE